MNSPRSLRWRIIAWYAALFSLQILLFSLFFDRLLAGRLRDRLDVSLRSELDTAVGMFRDEMEEMKGDVMLAAKETASGMRVHDSLVAIVSGGQVLAVTGGGHEDGITGQMSGLPRPGVLASLPGYGSHGARAILQRLDANGRTVVVLALAPMDSVAAVMKLEREVLFLFLPLMMGLAIAGGWVIFSRGLAPLGWMARQAREISGSSLHRRLDIGEAAEELRSLAESFNELLERLDQSFESMRRFVTDASHELRTPLAIIRGEADVAISQDRSAAEYRASLAIVLDESRRLSRLVDDLLNLARADSGHVKLKVESFYLNDVVSECCRSLQPLAGARGVRLECEAADDAAISGDEGLIRRLVMNLLDNAVRYTPTNGRVTAALKMEPLGASIRISDTGPGISPEAAPRVFDRFFRVDEARSRADGGFGLGLSIVKWIAETHHGAVRLESRPGEGSVFTVTLPRQA